MSSDTEENIEEKVSEVEENTEEKASIIETEKLIKAVPKVKKPRTEKQKSPDPHLRIGALFFKT